MARASSTRATTTSTTTCAGPVDLEEGETYILHDVKATSDPDGALILEIIPGVTDIGQIDPEPTQQPLDTDDEDDDPDGGAGVDSDNSSKDESIDNIEQAKDAVLDVLEEHVGASSRSYLRKTVLGSSLTCTHLEDALGELDTAGRINDQGAVVELVGSNGEEEEDGDSQAERLPELVKTISDLADEESGAPHDAVVEDAGADAETVEPDIETLKQKGVVYEPEREKYRATERPQGVSR